MSNKDKVDFIFKMLVLVELIILTIIAGKLNTLYKEKKDFVERLEKLEIDYRIYEFNLSELQENKEVQFFD